MRTNLMTALLCMKAYVYLDNTAATSLLLTTTNYSCIAYSLCCDRTDNPKISRGWRRSG